MFCNTCIRRLYFRALLDVSFGFCRYLRYFECFGCRGLRFFNRYLLVPVLVLGRTFWREPLGRGLLIHEFTLRVIENHFFWIELVFQVQQR